MNKGGLSETWVPPRGDGPGICPPGARCAGGADACGVGVPGISCSTPASERPGARRSWLPVNAATWAGSRRGKARTAHRPHGRHARRPLPAPRPGHRRPGRSILESPHAPAVKKSKRTFGKGDASGCGQFRRGRGGPKARARPAENSEGSGPRVGGKPSDTGRGLPQDVELSLPSPAGLLEAAGTAFGCSWPQPAP